MKAGVPRPARSRPHSYSSPLGRGGTAVLSGDGEGLHTRRERALGPTKRARHEQTHGARIGRGDPPPPTPPEPGTPP